jgi:hypothetical protein
MVEQQLLFPSSFQSSLENLPIFAPRNKKWWKMDQKTLVKRRIKILDENKYIFYSNQTKKIILSRCTYWRCGRRWGKNKKHGLIR